MSALGQKQTLSDISAMSALPRYWARRLKDYASSPTFWHKEIPFHHLGSSHDRKGIVAQDRVVGLGGLELPTKRLLPRHE
jgi:hypothetical protein